jgi:hypothetical protein
MQLVIDEELLTFDSEEQTPNSIDSVVTGSTIMFYAIG